MSEPFPLRISTCLPEIVSEDIIAKGNHSVTHLSAVRCPSGLTLFLNMLYILELSTVPSVGEQSRKCS